MGTENQHANGDRGNNEPQPPAPEETNPSAGDQDNQLQSSVPEDFSHPEDRTKKINAPRILRNLIAESLGLPGWSRVEKKLVQLEDIIENLLNESGKSKG